jgi:hypothetical protein
MVKRSVKVDSAKKSPTKGNRVATAERAGRVALEKIENSAVDPALAKQSFSSEKQALEFFTESIVSKLEGNSAKQAEMQQFLQVLLETDPLLKEALLDGVNIKK